MNDTEILDWIEKRTEKGTEIKRIGGKWVVDFGLHFYEAKPFAKRLRLQRKTNTFNP